jgi:hypothetical protein
VVDLILHTVSCIGLTFILKYGSILEWLRKFLSKQSLYLMELFSCSLCLGFWAGAVVGLISPYNPLLFATYGAAVSWYADYVLDYIVAAIDRNK